ncbi:MAG: phosphatidylserine decarboxylase [Pseudomonadota bacterium]
MCIHKDGFKFILPAIAVTIAAYYINQTFGLICGLITVWMIYFFRNPKRYATQIEGAILAAAEGKIVSITTSTLPSEIAFIDKPVTKISTFLNIFDVHVNAIPVTGKVIDIQYHPGQFFNASMDKASDLNERNSVVIEYGDGRKMAVVQIAGLIARRIRCDLKVGDTVTQGQIFGIIRFGSRVDVYFDREVTPLVVVGQKSRLIETVLLH